MNIKRCFVYVLFITIHVSLAAQTHLAVPLGDPVYHTLEQAQMRGLCGFLPSAKPYSRAMVLSTIEGILANNETRRFGKLTEAEREVLEQFQKRFKPDRNGLDLLRGSYSTEHTWDDVYFSSELGFGADFTFAGGYYPDSGDFYKDIDLRFIVSFGGDLGKNTSYDLTLTGGFFKSPRTLLGYYNTYYEDFIDKDDSVNQFLPAYSEPLAYFPYTYKKHWDGFVWYITDISNSGQEGWPNELSIGYSMLPELAGIFFNGHVSYRFARLDREWAGMTNNGSLVLNQSAQPFVAIETTITPFNWLSVSSLTGVLEYYKTAGLKESAENFQNAFSIVMLEINYEKYMHIDFGSSVVWPKRFELGYIFPFADNFLYQNNIGDFDNMALFFNILGQYPGLGKLWFSLFLDEANPASGKLFNLSRQMFAFQFGTSVHIPWLAFSSATLSYTKVEPYNYTHTREFLPWYGDRIMEQNYVNGGKSLGHYIPPNSDEILVRLESMPTTQSLVRLQYQLIRHGADYGSGAVGGSSLWSELDPSGRDTKPNLRKYFLEDGAYQWMHIFKIGGEYSFTGFNVPVKLFGEVGGVYSYFTNIDGEPNSGSPSSYKVINTPEYPHSLGFIAVLGVRIFPK